jgi:chromosome segregation ATPase
MKHFQQNLLIALALALCALCVWQWRMQTRQREIIGAFNLIVFQKNSELQSDTNSIAVLNHQVEQMDARMTEIKSAAATNEQMVVSQKRELNRLEFDNLNLTNEITQYKASVDTLQSHLKNAYADLVRQNTVVTNLVAQRDDFVKKYNDSVKDRNEVVQKYNELVNQVQKPSDKTK